MPYLCIVHLKFICMKNFFRFLLMSLFLMTSFSAASCSDDDDDPAGDNSIVGTWGQVNDYGTVITVRFNSNKTGVIDFVYPDGSGSSTENFEYDYLPEDRYLEVIGSQLDGEYVITLTAAKIHLKKYGENKVYEFTRK